MRRVLGLFLLVISLLPAQIPSLRFTAYKTTTLAAAVEKITIQQPATGAARIIFEEAYIYCSVACTMTLSKDGTAATSTALTPVVLFAGSATVTAWSGSNAGAGTTIEAYNLAAGGDKFIDLAGVVLQGNGTAKNFSIVSSSITGDVRVRIRWREE